MPTTLTESTPLVEAAAGVPKSRKFRARLIQGGIQGSSGYYSEGMLRQHAGLFAKNTPVFLDHPGLSESMERPERSVRDLAGKLASDAVYEGDGLYADVEVYPHMAQVIEALYGDIGMSIRASGTVEASTQEGVRGPIVTSLIEVASVDFVTAAGAGGKVVALLESARANAPQQDPAGSPLQEARNVAQWLESRIHMMFTQIADDLYGDGCLTRDERIALSSAIGDGLAAFTTRVEADQPQLYQRDRWDGPPEGDAEISEADKATPENPGDITKVTENEPGTQPADDKKEGIVPELTEDQKRQLDEAAKVRADLEAANALLAEAIADKNAHDQTKQKLAEAEAKVTESAAVADRVTELETRLAESAARNQRLENDRAARAQVAEALKTSGLPEFAHGRLTESVCRDLPTTDGALDTTKLTEAITAAIDGEKAYVASIAEAAGAGSVRGLGGAPAPQEMTEADFDAELKESFIGIGMSPEAAQRAALGR